MSKYDPLREALLSTRGQKVHMSFDEIAALVGGLPESAYRYGVWWDNGSADRHVQARSWLRAGWLVDNVDLNAHTATFIR